MANGQGFSESFWEKSMSDETTVRFFEPSEEAVSAFQQAFRGNAWWKRLWYWLVRGRIATQEWVSGELCSALERALSLRCNELQQIPSTLVSLDEHGKVLPLVAFSMPEEGKMRLVRIVQRQLPGPGVTFAEGKRVAELLVAQLYQATSSDDGIRIDSGVFWSDGHTVTVCYRADDFLD